MHVCWDLYLAYKLYSLSICEARDIVYADNILDFKYPGIGANLLAMALSGIVYFIITLLWEQNFFMERLFIAQTATRAEIYEHDVSDYTQCGTSLHYTILHYTTLHTTLHTHACTTHNHTNTHAQQTHTNMSCNTQV